MKPHNHHRSVQAAAVATRAQMIRRRAVYLAAFQSGLSISDSARHAGVALRTARRYRASAI